MRGGVRRQWTRQGRCLGDLTAAPDRATTVTIERLLAHRPQLLGAVALLDSLVVRGTGQSRWRW